MSPLRTRCLALAVATGALCATLALAQAPTFFRIGTGGTGGTYYPIGGLIANAISGNAGKGVAGLVATAVASNGSVANINAIQGGSSEVRVHAIRRRLVGLYGHRAL